MSELNLTELAKEFFNAIEKHIGSFDRPFEFRPFPFDAGGALNFLTIGSGRQQIVTYVSWDLFGHEKQKRGSLGRYEFLINCDNKKWVVDILTDIGRQSLANLIEAGDTMDIGPWVGSISTIQGVVFPEAIKIWLGDHVEKEQAGLLLCIGVTRAELEFATKYGVSLLVEHLKRGHIYPNTIIQRDSVDLS